MGRVLIKSGYVITIDARRRECRVLCLKFFDLNGEAKSQESQRSAIITVDV